METRAPIPASAARNLDQFVTHKEDKGKDRESAIENELAVHVLSLVYRI